MLKRAAIILLALGLLAPVAFADPALTPPTPPTNVNVAEADEGTTVSWDPPLSDGGGDVLYYRVYKNDALLADNLLELSYVDVPVGMASAASASYYVTAVNEAGESAPGRDGDCIFVVGVDPGSCVAFVLETVCWAWLPPPCPFGP